MPIEMPKGLPFSVDTWTPSSKIKRYHFLTHAHKDHSSQIAHHSCFPIYATFLTKTLLLQQFPQLHDSLFVEIEVGATVVIDDPDGQFSVTAFDANHCPAINLSNSGAVMFLFEGDWGNILHTGDCRLTPECLQNLPMKYLSKKGKGSKSCLDYLFLDCTFGKCSLKIPSKSSAVQQVINCIWKYPIAPVVYLACDMLGQEEILVEVSKTFGSKIFVDQTKNKECFQALTLVAPYIISEDPSSRFQIFEAFPRLSERANTILTEARANLQPEPLFLRPSAQWYACDDRPKNDKWSKLRFKEAERDQFGVWHVCYSMHSSKEELEWALQLLMPKRVISTTPTCRAMELDYVKKTFSSTVSSSDPLWKLLHIKIEESNSLPVSSIPKVSIGKVATSLVARPNHLELKLLSTKDIGINLDSSPPSNKRPIPLFGRARLALQDSNLFQEKRSAPVGANLSCIVTNEMENLIEVSFGKSEDVVVSERERIGPAEKEFGLGNTEILQVVTFERESGEAWVEKPKDERETEENTGFDASLRRLYRSMNVPVPRPLPSLVERMKFRKRVKIYSSEGGDSSIDSTDSYNTT